MTEQQGREWVSDKLRDFATRVLELGEDFTFNESMPVKRNSDATDYATYEPTGETILTIKLRTR